MPLIANKPLNPFGGELVALLDEFLLDPDEQHRLGKQIMSRYGKTCAVMFTDLSGFSSSVHAHGVVHSLARVYQTQKQFFPLIESRNGQILKSMGDSLLVVFSEPVQAYYCGLEMLKLESELSVGLGYGDVIQLDGRDVFGNEVNRASRLAEDIGKGGQLLLSGSFFEAISHVPDVNVNKIDLKEWDAFEVQYSL